MKTSIQLIIAAVIIIAINGVFFEYAISRDLPLLLTIISAIAILVIDGWFFIQLVKKIKQILNF
jgi:hypothetical protein